MGQRLDKLADQNASDNPKKYEQWLNSCLSSRRPIRKRKPPFGHRGVIGFVRRLFARTKNYLWRLRMRSATKELVGGKKFIRLSVREMNQE